MAVQEDLLEHKWMPCNGNFTREILFQVVVPSTFCGVVMQTARDSCGHVGIKIMCDCVLCYFLMCRVM